jgi:hypothetical protein
MIATLAPPTRVPPLPGGGRIAPAPRPDACECGGIAPDPDLEAPCSCGGLGAVVVPFLLGETRSYGYRRAVYAPVCSPVPGRAFGELILETGRRSYTANSIDGYQLAEMDCDGEGRAFKLLKVTGEEKEEREVFIGPNGVSCSCQGATYLATAKANQRAHDRGDPIYPSYGCRHADSCVALLLAGWLDLGSTS